jgi:hypothetical protein
MCHRSPTHHGRFDLKVLIYFTTCRWVQTVKLDLGYHRG